MDEPTTPAPTPREVMFGFDARASFQPPGEVWPVERREQYLYRPEIRRPVSVDVAVWPTIFEATRRKPSRRRVGAQDFWAQFTDLRATLTDLFRREPLPKFSLIAAALIDPGDGTDLQWTEELPKAVPEARDPQWQLLGYDVADRWCLSALTNCGFTPGEDDVPRLRQKWGPLLNDYHLFNEREAADGFRHMSDKRLAGDHAPTYVFGVWRVT